MAKASDIKNGNILRFNGELVQVEEFIHRTPGNLRAFYQARMRNVRSGKIVEYRFRTDEEVNIARVETNDYQYLYDDGDGLVIMDNATYEQHTVPRHLFGNGIKFLKEGMNVIVAFESDEPIMAQTPASAELEITYTEPAVKGDTSTGAMKKATVETGTEINVPLFITKATGCVWIPPPALILNVLNSIFYNRFKARPRKFGAALLLIAFGFLLLAAILYIRA